MKLLYCVLSTMIQRILTGSWEPRGPGKLSLSLEIEENKGSIWGFTVTAENTKGRKMVSDMARRKLVWPDHERLWVPWLVSCILLYRKIGFCWTGSRNGSSELYPHSTKITMATPWKMILKVARLETGRAFRVCRSNDPDEKLWSLFYYYSVVPTKRDRSSVSPAPPQQPPAKD